MMLCFSSASVILEGRNFTLKFDDVEANFAPPLGLHGMCGKLYIAEPIDGCSQLRNRVEDVVGNCSSPIALIVRGGCSFEDKIRRAQNAGFEAAIIYDNEDVGSLVAMAGNSAGIKIPAVFVSKATGNKIKTYGAGPDVEVWILASYESSAWSIMAISFISLLAMSAVLATCFFVRRHRIRRERPRARVREFHGMSSRLVKAMPSLVFTTVTEENCTASTCAICLEDYRVGDKIRILPCRHKFHTFCVDAWLTSWRTFCPVCKRDARTSNGEPPASESTPLLSSNPSSAASSPFSSFRSRSSSVRSSAIQIASPSPRSHSTSRNSSISSSPQIPRPLRSSLEFRNMSSQRSYGSQFMSPGSLGYPSISPLNGRYISPYIPSPSNGSSSYLGSSSLRYPNPLHYSESAASFSTPYDSAQSLPGC
ncbi:hypothetical protein SOVF_066880 [Spinacia oleracea]|nr:hypothetical protein SOVF_066880 [Spinacia oleracea]